MHPKFRLLRLDAYECLQLVGSNWLLYVLWGADYFVPAFCSNLNFSEGPRLNRDIGDPLTASEAFWQILGARHSEAIHVHIATPTILFFGTHASMSTAASSVTRRSYAAFKFVGLPISLTTLALWAFLHQMLKGKEQLDVDARNDEREDKRDELSTTQKPTIECLVPGSPRAADIEVLVCNRSASIIAFWVPVEQQVVVQSSSAPIGPVSAVHLPLTNVLAKGENITILALTDVADYCAAATSLKRTIIWPVEEGALPLAMVMVEQEDNVRIVALFPDRQLKTDGSPPKAGSTMFPLANKAFFTLHQNGALFRWDFVKLQTRLIVKPYHPIARLAVLDSVEASRIFIVRHCPTKEAEIWRNEGEQFSLWQTLKLEKSATDVTSLALCVLGTRGLLALGRASGTVEVWDTIEHSRIHLSSHFEQPIKALQIINLTGTRCPICGMPQSDSVALATTSNSYINVIRLSAVSLDACDCRNFSPAITPSPLSPGLGTSSFAMRRAPSPRSLSDDLSNANRTLSYPLSPHGLRRLSRALHSEDKKTDESAHRSEGSLELPNGEMHEAGDVTFEHLREASSLKADGTALETVYLPWRTHPYGRIETDDKGAWLVCGSTLVGIRRRIDSRRGGGGVLAKWVVWTCRLDRPTLHHHGVLQVQAAGLFTMLEFAEPNPSDVTPHTASGSPSQGKEVDTSHIHLPFDKVRHFRAAQDGQTAAIGLGNLLAVFKLEDTSLALHRSISTPFTR